MIIMVDSKENHPENITEFIRLSPSGKTGKMKTIPGNIAFKIFSPDSERPTSSGEAPFKQGVGNCTNMAKHGVLKAKRRTLATLQPSANSKERVVGISRVDGQHLSKKKCIGQNERIEKEETCNLMATPTECHATSDTEQAACTETASTDSEISDVDPENKDSLVEDALQLLNSNPSPVIYWKDLAEERRLALEEALTENEQLYDEVDHLKQKVADLEEALSKAKCYKLLYRELLEEKSART